MELMLSFTPMLKVDFGGWGQNLESSVRLLLDSCLKSTLNPTLTRLPWKLKAGFIAGFYELSYLILIDSGLNVFSVPTKPKFPELMLEYVNEDAREWITNLVDVI